MQISGYEIIEQIGSGANGIVYKARQVSLGRIVAIKVLRPELSSDPVAVAQFRLEANAVAHLKHPNILWVHEAGEVDGLPYFVMEYVAAYSVGQWLRRKGRISESDCLTVADSIARALKYAWDRAGLIHCDIKPDNILIDEDGIVKVGDFSGLSRDNLLPESELIRRFTIGTPNYMAPEQSQGLVDLDFRVDIYALGALLYHMATGVMPFAGLGDEEVMRSQITGYLSDPLEISPHLSPPFVALIEKLLVKDRNARGPDWDSVIHDIAEVRAGRLPSPPLPLPGASTLRRSVATVRAATAGGTSAPPHRARRRKVWLPDRLPMPDPSELIAARRRRRLKWLTTIALALFVLDAYLLWRIFGSEPARLRLPWRSAPPTDIPAREDVGGPPPSMPEGEGDQAETPPPQPVTYHEPPAPEPEPPTSGTPVPATPEVPSPETPPKPTVTDVQVAPGPELEEPRTADEPKAPPAVAEPTPSRFLEAIELLTQSANLCQRRAFDGAMRLIDGALVAQPAENPEPMLLIERDGLRRVNQALDRLVARGSRLAGVRIESAAGGPGEIEQITRNRLVIVRRHIGEGFLSAHVELLRLGDSDMDRLFRAADPEFGSRDAAAWAIATGNLRRARELLINDASEDAMSLQSWLNLRIQLQKEATALLALQEARRLAQAGRYGEVFNTLYRAREAVPDSRVITWAAREEWNTLEEAAMQEIQRGRTPSPPSSSGSPPDAAPRDDVVEGETVSIRDLRQRPQMYDGKTVRVRFRSRGTIESVGGGRYRSALVSEEGIIEVEFPEAGLRWFSSLPEFLDRASARYVFGIFDAERQLLQLLGRTRRVPIGGRATEYGW